MRNQLKKLLDTLKDKGYILNLTGGFIHVLGNQVEGIILVPSLDAHYGLENAYMDTLIESYKATVYFDKAKQYTKLKSCVLQMDYKTDSIENIVREIEKLSLVKQ